MMLALRLFVLVSTAWALQEINRCPGKLGGFYDYNDFVVRLSISQGVGQRVVKKMALKNVDILNIVENFLQWTTDKKDVFSKERCMILNFG
jgi:hypothetical protein